MSLISLNDLCKDFYVLNRREGVAGAIKDLFSRDYKTIKAVNNINLEIEPGEIIGFLGPNGAGKSTTIKMMTGVMNPTSGKVIIDGMDPFKERRRFSQNIGVVFGQRSQLWWELPVIESFKLLKEMYKVSDKEYNDNMAMFSDVVEIGDFLNRPVKTLSLGQRMLCEIIASLLHSPKIVFLDEPTIGLDVMIKSNIRELIKELNRKKLVTIILTTHDMGDIDALCERIVIIDNGKKIYDGNIERIKELYGGYRTIKVNLLDASMAESFSKEITNECKDSISISDYDNGWITVEVIAEKAEFLNVLNTIMRSEYIKDIKSEDISTESAIKKIYENF